MAEPVFPDSNNNKSISARAKKIINNAKWLTLFALFGRASWLITLLLIGRTVGPASFGEVSAYMAFWLITSRFFGLGLEIWVNKHIASNHSETERLKITVIAQRLRVTLVGTGCSLILTVCYLLPEQFIAFFPVFLLLSFRQFAESLREVQVGILQGREQMRTQALALIPWDLAQLALVALCSVFLLANNLYLLVTILTITSYGKILTLGGVIHKNTPTNIEFKKIPIQEYKDAIGESFYFGLSMLLALGLGKVDVLLLRTFTSPETVGNYSIAYLFLNVCVIILGIVRQALFPSLAHLANKAREQFLRLASLSSLFFFIAGLAGAILLGLLGPFFIHLTNKSFNTAPHLLILLAYSLPWVALASALGNAVNAGGLAKIGVIAQCTGLFFNIIANLYWIPKYGGAGAAYATLLAYAVIAFGYAYILRTFRTKVI